MNTSLAIKLVLFDLDGTLIDTAPDLLAAINQMRTLRHLPTLPLDDLFMRNVNGGKKAMLYQAFKVTPEDSSYAEIETEFEGFYAKSPSQHSKAFPGVLELLQQLDEKHLKWGIVTNKMDKFTQVILKDHKLLSRAAIVVSGDTLAHCKPHPMPLLHACHQLDVSPANCIYVGDAETDMIAAHRAAMRGAVALFGYGARHQDPKDWPASIYLETPQDLFSWLQSENGHTK